MIIKNLLLIVVIVSLCLLFSANNNINPAQSLVFPEYDTPENSNKNKIVIHNDKEDNKDKEQKEAQFKSAVPSPKEYETEQEDIELEGIVNYIVDGDTLDINDIRIRLSLVDTPERGQEGFKQAKEFVKKLCLNKKGQVDIDDGQRRGDRYGRDIGVVFCDGVNINKALVDNNLARIYTEYCDISEFKNENWAKPDCR
ncbi:MAG TPA: thermonuclease family protein [Nitrososphaeraceae archaeon]|nr:thermonuclease family protein [Nitrososphaeraceae archaeon]